jgi:hypothetical protein
MPELNCVYCGSPLIANEGEARGCVKCSATTIVRSEGLRDALVTPSPLEEGICRELLLVRMRSAMACADSHSTPSILKEYHSGFFRLLAFSCVWVALLVACMVLLFLAS